VLFLIGQAPDHDTGGVRYLLVAQCQGAVITKVRHLVPVGAFTFEIDVFEGENARQG
jgi:CYTH domain-containing protein